MPVSARCMCAQPVRGVGQSHSCPALNSTHCAGTAHQCRSHFSSTLDRRWRTESGDNLVIRGHRTCQLIGHRHVSDYRTYLTRAPDLGHTQKMPRTSDSDRSRWCQEGYRSEAEERHTDALMRCVQGTVESPKSPSWAASPANSVESPGTSAGSWNS
jgi:hypothetical protein